MRAYKDWKDYELIDCSDGERLERWGDIVLVRPDPQSDKLRRTPLNAPHAVYNRSSSGGGSWAMYSKCRPCAW